METIIVEKLNGIEWIEEKVELNVEADFAIDEDKVDSELSRMGHLLSQYGLLAAELKAEVSRKESDVDNFYAYLYLKTKEEEAKTTEAYLKQTAINNLDHQSLMISLNKTTIQALKMQNLFKSLEKKADCLITLAYNKRAEFKAYQT